MEKVERKRVGNLDVFDSYLGKFMAHKGNFKVVSYGLTRKIILPEYNREYLFFGSKSVEKNGVLSGAFLCRMVKKDIDAFAANPKNKKRMPVVNSKSFRLVQAKKDVIHKIIGQKVRCLDINSCYITAAYSLGYITKKTYSRCLSKKEYKPGVLAAIGTLNKMEYIETYENGKLNTSSGKFDWKKHNKYSPFYWKIIEKVWDCMEACADALGNDFYMWLTDCAFISVDAEKKCGKIIKQHGFEYKRYFAEFISVDAEFVKWKDLKKKEEKQIAIRDFTYKRIKSLIEKIKPIHGSEDGL